MRMVGLSQRMTTMYDLTDFFSGTIDLQSLPTYWYSGQCSQTGAVLKLPRTDLAEAIAKGLMRQLSNDERYSNEGKMYGVLLVKLPTGELQVLKAFSGLLNGNACVAGWVPPIPGRDRVAFDEAVTLARLNDINQTLMTLQQRPEWQDYQQRSLDFEHQLNALRHHHQQRKAQRHQHRQELYQTLSEDALAIALAQLTLESQIDGIAQRQLKRQRDAVLNPLKQVIAQLECQIRDLKQQRKSLSRSLQAQMHANYQLTNFLGTSISLQQLMPGGVMPTGTGECCAPKLLHYAATHTLQPVAMAEFWWGSTTANGDKVQGQFYGACLDRCQPLMGFLLSGVSQRSPSWVQPTTDLTLPIVYEDDRIIAVNKPAGLLSVPGRYRDRQDSVLSRLQLHTSHGSNLMAVHRLDQDTSGILLIARDAQTHRQLSQQFQQRQVIKIYEALLSGEISVDQGMIDLPLWSDPSDRPYQKVDPQRGKPSQTQFHVLARESGRTRVEFIPITGRTHQLRVHAAHPQGLATPILGDRLYGREGQDDRLYLHARELKIVHPQSGQTLHLTTPTPF